MAPVQLVMKMQIAFRTPKVVTSASVKKDFLETDWIHVIEKFHA